MNFAEYKDAVRDDAIEFINNTKNDAKDWDELWEWMELDDAITGLASEAYIMSELEAIECVAGVMWDSDFWQVQYDYDGNGKTFDAITDCRPQMFDCMVRWCALYALRDELHEYYTTGKLSTIIF